MAQHYRGEWENQGRSPTTRGQEGSRRYFPIEEEDRGGMRQSGYQDEQTRGSWHGWQQAVEPGWRSGSEREGAGYGGFEDEGRQGGFRDDYDRPFRFSEPRQQQYGRGYAQRYGEGSRAGRGRYEGGDSEWRGARELGGGSRSGSSASMGDARSGARSAGAGMAGAGMEWGRGYGERHDYPSFDEGTRTGQRSGSRFEGAEFSGSGSFWQSGGSRQQSFRGRGPKGYERSDERLKEMICERLTEDDDIDPSEISIEVSSGEVTLTGTVPDRRTKFQVEELVEQCGGVNEIVNQLRIDRGEESGQESEMPGTSSRRGSKGNRRSSSSASAGGAESQA